MPDHHVESIVQKVRANRKYADISIDLVRRLSTDTLEKGLSDKAAVKAVRNKLHQIGGAYLDRNRNYSEWINTLSSLPRSMDEDVIKEFCRKSMAAHVSTAERLPILETFFRTCLEPIAPIQTVLDLACGLNPMAVPWMPLAGNATYAACDIYEDMLNLIQRFLSHLGIINHVFSCDLTAQTPEAHVQVAMILKSIPCLEQLDKFIGKRLLETINADHILVSFPVHSLGGKPKGMLDFYRQHFYNIVAGMSWDIQEVTFSTEMAFLISK